MLYDIPFIHVCASLSQTIAQQAVTINLKGESDMEQKQILSPDELAGELGIHVVTLAQARQANSKSEFSSLPFVRIGRKIFYRREDVNNFLNEHTVSKNSTGKQRT